MYILTEHDSGKLLQLGVGEVFFLALEDNDSIGYRWRIDPSPLLEITLEDSIKGADVVGAPGLKLFRFMAKKTGENELLIKDQALTGSPGQKQLHFRIHVD
ncbi:protease inhibitor I42 family protein [Bacillus sp. NPDC077027]|uniref:protease inhibitor I42 family protein n=1 Tax=Bacillus sp. NPDC077027 TaxID=3390548 RepID=UPI003CFCA082